MINHSKNHSTEKHIQIPEYCARSSQKSQQIDDEQFYFDKMEKHLNFMEKEFKLSIIWQRELMKQIKEIKINEQVQSRKSKKYRTIQLNSKQEFFIKQLLRNHCHRQINRQDLQIHQLIKIASQSKTNCLYKHNQQQKKQESSYVPCPPPRLQNQVSNKHMKVVKNANKLFGIQAQLKAQKQQNSFRQEIFQNQYLIRQKTNCLKDFSKNINDQHASLNYSLSQKEQNRQSNEEQQQLLLICNDEKPISKYQAKKHNQQEYANKNNNANKRLHSISINSSRNYDSNKSNSNYKQHRRHYDSNKYQAQEPIKKTSIKYSKYKNNIIDHFYFYQHFHQILIIANYNQKQYNHQRQMNLEQFLKETEPITKLISTYIEHQSTYDPKTKPDIQKKQTYLLNSILLSVATKKTNINGIWNEIKYCLEVNSSDRDCLRRGAQLLTQILRRNPNSLLQAPKQLIVEILKFSCEKAFITVCGNDFIAQIQYITEKIHFDQFHLQSSLPVLNNFLLSNKLQINSYRQQTRLSLYKFLLKILTLQQKNLQLLEKSVKAGQGEKDPRNISAVFQIYLKILSIFPQEQLLPYRAMMFQNIEAYYPIEFVGDQDNEQHRKVNISEISALLDQCICHPFFAELSWELLSTKTAAPPLAPFISTLLTYIQSMRSQNTQLSKLRLSSLLTRFSEQDFIAEQYEQHAPLDVTTVIQRLVDVIFCRQDSSFNLQSYQIIKKWLQMMIGKVTIGQCKHSGTMMGIFRNFINRTKINRFQTLIEIVRTFSLRAILKTINNGQIIPKLGLSIVVSTSLQNVSEDVKELIALLVLKVGSLYGTVSDEVKLLLLKILLQIYKGSQQNRWMVRKVNDGLILKDILSKAEIAFANCPTQNQAYIIKAYIDFVSNVYINQIDLLLEHIKAVHFQLQVYLLGRLWENATLQDNQRKIVDKFNVIINKVNTVEDSEHFIKGLKAIQKTALKRLVFEANWERPVQFRPIIFSILCGIRQQLDKYGFDQGISFAQTDKLKQSIATFYVNKNQQNLSLSRQELLWRNLGNSQENTTFPQLKSIQSYQISNQLHQQFISCYAPTFIQWYWQNIRKLESSESRNKKLSQILKWLPQPLLLKDRQEILTLVLTDAKCAPSLLKIVKHIDLQTIKSAGILNFCLQYIEAIDKPQNTTERNACILATLVSIAQRDKAGQLKNLIKKSQKKLKELRLHRKRVIRQAVRKLLCCLLD